MKNTHEIMSTLKKKGYRSVPARKEILNLLIKIKRPLSSLDIQKLLSKKKIFVHKTTVYRQLAFFKEQKLVQEVQFSDRIKRYEMTPDTHHHHIICIDCKSIENIELKNDLNAEENLIIKTKDFKVLDHSLEFYGICRKCQTSTRA